MIEDVFGYLGCVFLVITLVPQLVKTYKTKRADDISPIFVVLALFTTIIYLTYGILIDEKPIITANSILLFQNFLLLYFKFIYSSKNVIESKKEFLTTLV
jgi:MtN3 and saliva related transmembrane protein